MRLSRLRIENLRNIKTVEITPHSQLNFLIGPNGSGKTSLLESIYLLGLGRSFRTQQLSRAIQYEQEEFLLYAELISADKTTAQKLGFSKNKHGKVRIKLNEMPVESMAELAQLLPVLLLYSESYAFFRESPQARRKWLDWGMFHVEPRFYPLWKKLQRVLQQRNALLKQNASDADLRFWDLPLVELATELHALRIQFVSQWQMIIAPVLESLFSATPLHLTYHCGWDPFRGLEAELACNLRRDRAIGYTSIGPHRADVLMHVDDVLAQHCLSLGQQKLLVAGIILGLGKLVKELSQKCSVILIDDLPAELDSDARERISTIIHSLDAQIFLTGIDKHTLAPYLRSQEHTMFHVEHGVIQDTKKV